MSLHTWMPNSFTITRKATRITKDYVFELYYPIHRMSWRDRLKCLPLLMLTEYMVYYADTIAEHSKDIDFDRVKNWDYAALERHKAKFVRLLKWSNSYNSFVEREVEMGEQYIRLENRLTANRAVNHLDVMKLAELRPSDVRLLHCLIFGLLKQPCDEELLSLLWPVEVLADIGNDFEHYAEDVASSRYNTYAMFVKLYCYDAPTRIRAEIEKYENLFLDRLARISVNRRDEVLALCFRRYRAQTSIIPDPVLAL